MTVRQRERKEVVRATVAVAASRALGFPLALMVSMWLTRVLSREDFAFFGVLASLAILFAMFAQVGFQTSVVRMLGEAEAGDDTYSPPAVVYSSTLVTLLASTLLAVLFYFAGRGMLPEISGGTDWLFLLAALLLVSRAVNTNTAQALRGIGKVGMSANLSGQGPQGGIVRCLFMLAGFGITDYAGVLTLEMAIIISIIASVLVSLLALLLVLRHTGFRFQPSEIARTATARSGDNFNMMLSEALIYWTSASAAVVIGGAIIDAALMAGVVAAFQLRNIITSPLTIIAGATPKILIRLNSKGEKDELQRVLRGTASVAFLMSLGACLALIAIGPWGFELLFGAGYGDAYYHFVIMALGIVFYVYSGLANQALLLMGDTRHQRNAMIWALVVTMPLYVLLAWYMGPYGVSVGLAFSMVFQQLLLVKAVRKHLGVDTRAYIDPREYLNAWTKLKPMLPGNGNEAAAGRKPVARTVLVTGAPRSGTTVVGELLGSAPGAIELYEPMSDIVGDRAVRDWFPVPGQEGFDEQTERALVDRIVRRRVRTGFRPENIQGQQGRNRFLNRTNRTAILARLQPWKRTQIWKDPMALMIAPRIAREGQIPVIITVRDHLSLASSYKRMDWHPPVAGLVRRMQQAGLRIDPRIPELVAGQLDTARAGAIAWNLFYGALLDEMRAGLPATVILNSDLMVDPEAIRQRLIAVTGLAVPPPGQAAEYQSEQAGELPQKAHIANRSLESVTQYWKKTLSEDEVAFIRDLNDGLWAELEAEVARQRASW